MSPQGKNLHLMQHFLSLQILMLYHKSSIKLTGAYSILNTLEGGSFSKPNDKGIRDSFSVLFTPYFTDLIFNFTNQMHRFKQSLFQHARRPFFTSYYCLEAW